jgi:hypothetical protein
LIGSHSPPLVAFFDPSYAGLDVLFCKSGSKLLDSRDDLVCDISRIGEVFQTDFSFAQSFTKCLISQSLSEL